MFLVWQPKKNHKIWQSNYPSNKQFQKSLDNQLDTVPLLQKECDYKNMQATKNPKNLRICAA